MGRAQGRSPAGTRCRRPAPRLPALPTPRPWRSGPQGRSANERAEGARTPRPRVAGRPRGKRRGVGMAAASAGTLSSGTERRRRGSVAAPGEEAGTTTTTLRRRPAPSAPRPARPRRAPGSRPSLREFPKSLFCGFEGPIRSLPNCHPQTSDVNQP